MARVDLSTVVDLMMRMTDSSLVDSDGPNTDNFMSTTENSVSQVTGNSAAPIYVVNPGVMRIVYLIISAIGFSLNAFTIAIICLHKPMRQHFTNAFIVNQSLIDAMASVFMFFSTIYQNDLVPRIPGNLADEALCRLWFTQLPMYGMFVSSIYGIVALTFERFLGVVYPFWHKAHFSKGKVAAIFVFVWLVGTCYYVRLLLPRLG